MTNLEYEDLRLRRPELRLPPWVALEYRLYLEFDSRNTTEADVIARRAACLLMLSPGERDPWFHSRRLDPSAWAP